MCELYGITGDSPVRANDMLKEFYTHSHKHPHGWGLRYFNKNGTAFMCKEAVSAHNSLALPELLDHEIETPVLIAHIRFATVGSIAGSNSHPFTSWDNSGREWTLAHNGNIYSGFLPKYNGMQFTGWTTSNVKASLVGMSEQVMVESGELILGLHQSIYMVEFNGPSTDRRIYLSHMGTTLPEGEEPRLPQVLKDLYAADLAKEQAEKEEQDPGTFSDIVRLIRISSDQRPACHTHPLP